MSTFAPHPGLTGSAHYTADLFPADAARMVVVRSPVAHGRITALDVADARAMPGVLGVLTAADLEAAGVGPIALRAPLTDTDTPFRVPYRPVLAQEKVAFVGQPVAAVIARTEAEALDAAEVIGLDIDTLDPVMDPLTTTTGETIWAEVPDNSAFRWHKGNPDESARLMAEAAHVVSLTVHHPRVNIAPVETRAALATYRDGAFTLTTPSQGVVTLRRSLSATMGIDIEALRVVTPHVGGSFAVKIWPYPEHVLALVAARATGRPVAWHGGRTEAFIGDTAGRGRTDRGRLALDADGRFLAFEIDAVADMGAFLSTAAPSTVTAGAVRPYSQVYHIPGQVYRVEAVLTNAPPTDAYRGAGKPESTATLERLIDVAAAEMGIERFELRRRNLLRPEQLPYRTPMAETYDGGDFPRIADAVSEAADWDGLAERKAASAAKGLMRGGAIGFQVHASGGTTEERSEVRALADGTVIVRSGSMDSGQGHRESLAIIASEALEIPVGRIRVEQGDTAFLEVGGGSGGSNLAPVAVNTVHRASLAMLDRAKEKAAEMLEVARADLDYNGGTFRITGTDRTASLGDIAAAIPAEDEEGGCIAQTDFEGIHTTFPNGALICEVEVDPETGHVRLDRLTGVNDLGRLINEPAALGQIHGGIGQAVGEALGEGMVFDADGQPLTASLMDYPLPRADEIPMIANTWAATPSPNALLGAKGVGELPSIGTPVLIVNAVLDALAPHGVSHLDKPLTPVKIWQALRGTP